MRQPPRHRPVLPPFTHRISDRSLFPLDSERTIWRLAHWLTDDTLGKVPLTSSSFFFFFSLPKRKSKSASPKAGFGFAGKLCPGWVGSCVSTAMTRVCRGVGAAVGSQRLSGCPTPLSQQSPKLPVILPSAARV